MYLFCYGKKRADRVVIRWKRVGDKEHRNTNRSKHSTLPSRPVLLIFATTSPPPPPPPPLSSPPPLAPTTPVLPPPPPPYSSNRSPSHPFLPPQGSWPATRSEFKMTVITVLYTCAETDRAQRLHYTNLRPHKASRYVSSPSFSLVIFSI